MSAPNVRGPQHTFGFIPSHSAERLNGPPGVGPYSRRLAVNTDDRTSASSTYPMYFRQRGKAVEYAGVPDGGSLLVLGLGPIGDMACRIAQQKWIDKIIAVDLWTSGWSERWPTASR